MKSPIVISLMLVAHSVWATSPADLEKQAGQEAKWKSAAVELPQAKGTTNFLLTTAGKYRLESMGAGYLVDLKVSADEYPFDEVREASDLPKVCKDLKAGMEYEIEKGRDFEFSMLVNPLSREILSKGISDGGLFSTATPIENTVKSVNLVSDLQYIDGAVSPLTTSQRLQTLRAHLNQMIVGGAKIGGDGVLRWTWKGVDDLVCDIASGKIALRVQLTTQFDAARLTRVQVLSSDSIQRLGRLVSGVSVPEGGGQSAVMGRVANLGVALNQELGGTYDKFMRVKFAKFLPLIVDLATGELKPTAQVHAEKIARQLDDLEQRLDINQSLIQSQMVWKVKGWGN
ncbi:MAG TPA: hypothetical protein PKC28_12500 [Bdellovibrionales bacterium]|nr:hypothetical protein [Bdellovibrionales bacterium]